MKALLIDPVARSVEALDIADNLTLQRAAIGAEYCDNCRPYQGVLALVDDVGLIKGDAPAFLLQGYANPIVGKTLLLGVNAIGESVDCPLEVDRLRLTWLTHDEALAIAKDISAQARAYHQARGRKVETDASGLVNIVTGDFK